MDPDIYEKLGRRIGQKHLSKRLTRQVDLAAKFYARGGYASFHLENVELIHVVLKLLLKAMGLYRRGLRNAIDFRVENIRVPLKNLPEPFDGFRILHLTDLHADAFVDGGQELIGTLRGLETDLCVITGDYRFMTQDVHDFAVERTAEIADAVHAPSGIYGILGNHDFIEFVPELEASGIRMLLNEAVPIASGGSEFWLAGIDDAHLYDCHDIDKALSKAPKNKIRVLLSHTPETFAEAAEAGVDYMLCGHTHGGQICLPGGTPIITNARCPRKYCAGSWKFGQTRGYTSRAAGSSGLPVRFNCPPEITVHELRRID